LHTQIIFFNFSCFAYFHQSKGFFCAFPKKLSDLLVSQSLAQPKLASRPISCDRQ